MRRHTARLMLHLTVLLTIGCTQRDGGEDHGHSHGEPAGHDDHGEEAHGHGHGAHEGVSEAVTRYGEQTQLFVEFPALVAGEESAFAAHLTRLFDHGAVEAGTVSVELSWGGSMPERFSVEGPSVPGIFRPVVRPAQAGPRKVLVTLETPMSREMHDLGEFMVFETRQQADAAGAASDSGEEGEISYLLEQQWKVPFRLKQAQARAVRPNLSAFARLSLPAEAEVVITAPRDGRIGGVKGAFPRVGEEREAGGALFSLRSAPEQGGEQATLDLGVAQAEIEVAAARREVERLAPLVEQGVVAQRRLDEAQSVLEQAQAEQRSAQRRRAALTQSQRISSAGEGITVPSPLDGRVAELFVAAGSWVERGAPLARVVSSEERALWLDVHVPQAHVGELGEISGVWFERGVGEERRVMEVPTEALVSIGSALDPEHRTLPVRFRLNEGLEGLYGGMIVQVRLIIDAPHEGVVVPAEALVEEGGMDVVYVQTGGESFTKRVVRLGERDGADVEVLAGVSAGDWVVARGAHGVKLAASSTETIGHGHAH